MKHSIFLIFSIALITATFSSCGKASERQAEKDEEIIKEYLDCNNIDAQKTASGLYYVINEQGDGEFPTLMSDVTVAYTGFYPSENVFDQSPAGGAQFPLSGVIEGWQEGIQLFREGGNGTLFIPSALAYGTTGSNSIGGNAVIFFDIDLIDVDN